MTKYVVLNGWRSWIWWATQLRAPIRGWPRLTALVRRVFLRDAPIALRCGVTIKGNLGDYYWNRMAVQGYHEINTERFIAEFLRPGDTFVDVGAQIGMVTALAAIVVGPTGCVLSFEPDKKNLSALQQTIRRNRLSNTYPVPLALGDIPGDWKFVKPRGAWGSFRLVQQQDTFSRGETADQIGNEQAKYFKRYFRTEKQEVATHTVTTLDQYARTNQLGRITLVKIDVDGPEPLVLKGMSAILSGPSAPALIVEASYAYKQHGLTVSDLLDFLAGFGYEIFANETTKAEVNPNAENGPFRRIRRLEELPNYEAQNFIVNLYCLKPALRLERCNSKWFTNAWALSTA